MPRPRMQPGELGTVSYRQGKDGSVAARARVRDDAGAVHDLSRTAATEVDALGLLRRAAAELSTGVKALLGPDSTVAEACERWLTGLEVSGSVESSTLDSYENSVRQLVVPYCGAVRLRDLSVGRCDLIIQKVLAERSVSAGPEGQERPEPGVRLRCPARRHRAQPDPGRPAAAV